MFRVCALVVILAAAAVGRGNDTTQSLRLPKIFTDHMVLQRDAKIRLWGSAAPKAKVVAMLGTRGKNVIAGADGKWNMEIPPQPAGGPYALTVNDGTTSMTLKDVLVGDVWLCGGQSNMEWPVRLSNNAEQETQTANFPKIRLFRVMHDVSTRPKDELSTTVGWVDVNSESVNDFSAVGYFFGRELHQHLKVPIGLIQSAWGGSPAESWVSYDSLRSHPDYTETADAIWNEKVRPPREAKKHHEKLVEQWKKEFDATDSGYQDGEPVYASTDMADDDWKSIKLPNTWETEGLPDFDGLMWFRKELKLPKEMEGKELVLTLGTIDDADRTFFNGKQIGENPLIYAQRRYRVPTELVKPGRNFIAVRVHDNTGAGGFTGEESAMALQTSGTAESETTSISLAGNWKYKAGAEASDLPDRPTPPGHTHRSLVMYNAMIAPLVPYAIRGVIWYQGESNADRAYQYRTLFPLLIRDWRERWNQGEFPFLFVQLAGFGAYQATPKEPKDNAWAELREAQAMTLSVPKTAMATAIDIGDTKDIHPRNKQDVGKRLALAARKIAYGENVVHSGPQFESVKIKDGKAYVSFQNVGGGLVVKPEGAAPQGFAIAGADKKFVWADAKVEGDMVVVWSDAVKEPVAVRYGWAADPVLSLYNEEGLPALPFRTDDWKGLTDNNHRPARRKKGR